MHTQIHLPKSNCFTVYQALLGTHVPDKTQLNTEPTDDVHANHPEEPRKTGIDTDLIIETGIVFLYHFT